MTFGFNQLGYGLLKDPVLSKVNNFFFRSAFHRLIYYGLTTTLISFSLIGIYFLVKTWLCGAVEPMAKQTIIYLVMASFNITFFVRQCLTIYWRIQQRRKKNHYYSMKHYFSDIF